MALATLSIDIVARLAALEQGLDKAARLAEQNAAKIAGSYDKLTGVGRNLQGVLGGLTFGFVAREIVQFAGAVIDGVDKMNDLKDATGASVENISALEDVARRTGGSFDDVSSILIKFNKVLSDSEPGKGVSLILKTIGLDAEELKRIDPAEALRQTAVAFSRYADDGSKARAFQELFGKSIREAGPLLTDLAKQTKLVGTVSTEAAEQAERFNQQLSNISKSGLDAARDIAGPLTSALSGLIDFLKDAAKNSRDFFAELRRQEEADDAGRATKLKADRIAALNGLLAQGNITLERRARLERQLAGLTAAPTKAPITSTAADEATAYGRPSLNVPPDPKKAGAAKVSEVQKYIDRLAEATLGQLDLTNAEKADLALKGELAGATTKQAETIRELARGLDELTAKTEVLISAETQRIRNEKAGYDRTADDLRLANLDELNKRSAEFRSIIARTPTAQAAELYRLEVLLRDTIGDSAERADELAEAINTLYGTLPDYAKTATDQISEFAKQASVNIQDALGSTLADTLRGDFDNIGERWRNLLIDMAAQATAAQIGEALFGKAGVGGGGGLFGALLGALAGGSGGAATGFASLAGISGGRAGGGSTRPFGLYRVNENGPEGLTVQGRDYLMMGGAGGKVTPGTGVGGRGGDVIIQIASGVSRNDVAALIPTLKQQIKGELIQQMRRPGFSGN